MNISASDQLIVFQNILAQSPEGLNDPNLIGKFAKAKAQLHALSSMQQMNSQNIAPTMPIQAAGGVNTPSPDQSTTQGQLGATNDQNQPNPQEGQGTLNLPQ